MDQQQNNPTQANVQPKPTQKAEPYTVAATIKPGAIATFGTVFAIFLIVSGLPFIGMSFLIPNAFSLIPFITAMTPVFLGIVILVLIRLNRKHSDLNGDGLAGDLEPATEAQMVLIENGFRSLGQFYVRPKRRLTQAEARETLDRIQQQIRSSMPGSDS